MAAQNQIARPRTSTIAPPDLERGTVNLSRGVNDAMVSLFSLETALVNYSSSQHILNILQSLQSVRAALRSDWEKSIVFLQACQGYAEDYSSLCRPSPGRTPSEALSFVRDMLETAENISRDALGLNTRHATLMVDLEKSTQRLPESFHKERANQIEAPVEVPMEGHTLSHFVQVAAASRRPDGAQALKASKTALGLITASLRDLEIFWCDQVHQLAAITKRNPPSGLTFNDIQKSYDTWTRNRAILQRAISSITASSDAIQVAPVRAQKRTAEPARASKPAPTPPSRRQWFCCHSGEMEI